MREVLFFLIVLSVVGAVALERWRGLLIFTSIALLFIVAGLSFQ